MVSDRVSFWSTLCLHLYTAERTGLLYGSAFQSLLILISLRLVQLLGLPLQGFADSGALVLGLSFGTLCLLASV